MSVELEYLRLIPGSEQCEVRLVLSINGHSGKFLLSGVMVPALSEEPVTEPAEDEPPEPPEVPEPVAAMPKEKAWPIPFRVKQPEFRVKTWPESIVEALAGGNLTGTELMSHACRIRGVKVPIERSEYTSFRKAFSVNLNSAKKSGLVQAIVENGIDKWKLRAA